MATSLRGISLLLLLASILVAIGTMGCSMGYHFSNHGQQCHENEHNTYVKSIRFSNDGKYLFTQGDLDGQIIMWNIDTMKIDKVLVSPFQGFPVSSQSVFEVSPNGKILAYSRCGDVYLFDYEQQRDVGVFKRGPAKWVMSIAFMPNGKYLAIDNGIWNVKERKEYSSISDFDQVAFLPGKDVLIMGGEDLLVFYDIHTQNEIQRIMMPAGGGIIGLRGQALFTADGKRGFSLSENAHLSYFNVETGEVTASVKPWTQYNVGVGKIILDESKGRLYGISMGYENFTVSIFDIGNGNLLKKTQRRLVVPRDRDPNAGLNILDAVLSPDGKTLAVAGEDCMIQLFDIETLEPVGVLGEGCRVVPFKRPKIV